jgi:WS/DGAT/MGAT family acyltransferase
VKELSGLDASFLYLEILKIPIHMGGVAIVRGVFKFDNFQQYVSERICNFEKCTQNLFAVSLNLDRPSWIEELGISMHRNALTLLGGWERLCNLVSRLLPRQLKRDFPLWEFIFVEGLNPFLHMLKGLVALTTKVHHPEFDGKSGADSMSMSIDPSLTPRLPNLVVAKEMQEMLGPVELMAKSAWHFITRITKLLVLLWNMGKAIVKAGYITQVQGMKMSTTPSYSPKTRSNEAVEIELVLNLTILDIYRINALRKVVGGAPLNNVILAISTEVLKRYFMEKGELSDKPLVAMMPESTRTAEEKNAMGNQVSAIYVQLANDVEGSIKQLDKIQINTALDKLYQDAIDVKNLIRYAELIKFGLADVAARFYCSATIAKYYNNLSNVLITNVLGPKTPLYLTGHKGIIDMGIAPIFDSLCLNISTCSYDGTLSISPTSSANLMPDLDTFTRYIRESANELERAIQEKLAGQAAIDVLMKS